MLNGTVFGIFKGNITSSIYFPDNFLDLIYMPEMLKFR
jgi:hypothetical protein